MPSWILWLGIGAVVLSYFVAPLATGGRRENVVLALVMLLFVGGIATAGTYIGYGIVTADGGEPASATAGEAGNAECHPSYEGDCLDPDASDYDCDGGYGDGPKYAGPVTVVGYDEFDLDRDGDGFACEWS